MGLLLSAAGLFSTALMSPSGWMSDRFGRKPTLLLSVIRASFPLLYTVASDWHQLIPWAIIFAVSLAVFTPARMVYIADQTDSDERAKIYGYMNLAWPISILLGPITAGLLPDARGFHYPFYFAVAVSHLSFLPALLLAERRTLKPPSTGAEAHGERKTGFSTQAIYLLALLTMYQLLVAAGIGITYPLLSIYLTEVFREDELHVGLFFSLVGVSIFGNQLFGGWANSRFGLRKTMK